MFLFSTIRIIPGRAVPSFLSGRYSAVKVRKKLYVTCMATAVVSGRVDEQVKARVDSFIRAAGLSTGDVIRAVWERIAQTGEVPDMGKGAGQPDVSRDPMECLGELRSSFGACEDLVNHDDARMREMIASHYS